MDKRIKPISILFLGNSFSYYHSMPKLLAHFVDALGPNNFSVDGVFRGGATLKMLWDDGRALKKLRSKTWDYVVLQERGRLGGVMRRGVVHVGRPQVFVAYATRFNKEIEKIGATTILYCPPSYLGIGLPGDAKKLHATYVMLARKLHAILIPSVAAFTLALKKRPDLDLYERDRHHQNPRGAYLIAALFYKKLFHRKPSHFPLKSYSSRAARLPKNPKEIRLSKAEARFLWSIADQITRSSH